MTITSMKAQELNLAIQATLREFGEKHDLVMIVGNFRYSATGFKLSFEAKIEGDLETGDSITALALSMCTSVGFDPIRPNVNNYKIVDYRSRAPKYPWVVEQTGSGKRFCLTTRQAERYFKVPPGDILHRPTKSEGVYESEF